MMLVSEQGSHQYNRGSFKSTGNQIAAVGSPPFIGKNSLLESQQTPQFIGRLSRPGNFGKNNYGGQFDESELP